MSTVNRTFCSTAVIEYQIRMRSFNFSCSADATSGDVTSGRIIINVF